MNLNNILKEEIESIGFPIIQRSFFENVDIQKGDFNNPTNSTHVYAYHGSKNPGEKTPHDGMFFSVEPGYARAIGGPYVKWALLTINHPLYLDKYNKIFATKGLDGWFGQGLLTLSNEFIKNWWIEVLDSTWNYGFGEVVKQFREELKTCDSIYGEDSGNRNTKVWYIKHASQIKFM